ncbi:hypothetical protein STEG23_002839 [Scotinomys teguina]
MVLLWNSLGLLLCYADLLVCQYFIEYFYINVHEGDCLIISWHLFLLRAFASSHSRAFSFDLVHLSIGWNLPSSAFFKAGLVDRYSSNLILSWNVLFTSSMLVFFSFFYSYYSYVGPFHGVPDFLDILCYELLDLVFSLTDKSISSISFDFL